MDTNALKKFAQSARNLLIAMLLMGGSFGVATLWK